MNQYFNFKEYEILFTDERSPAAFLSEGIMVLRKFIKDFKKFIY